MADDKRKPPTAGRSLRDAAEAALKGDSPADAGPGGPMPSEETGRLLHELRVHQVELELQNEQLRASQVELERLRDRYFDLYDLAPVGYCTLTPEGLVVQANLAAATLLGHGRGDLRRKGLSRFLVVEDADAFLLKFRQLMRTGQPQALEVRLAGGGERPHWMRLSLTAGLDDAGASEIRVALSDITESKRAEAERAVLEDRVRETQGLEAIQTLAGGIAREFNNAVAIIQGTVQTVREDAGADARLLDSLDEIDKASARSRELVQQLLSFARRLPMRLEPTPLAPFVEAAVNLLRAGLPGNVTLETRCVPGVPAVMADAALLRQVLFNLTQNAAEALGARPGRIVIALESARLDAAMAQSRPALRELHAANPGPLVRLSVIDDGPGMDAYTARRSFEPFFTTKQGDKSAGLGLSAAIGIVAAHGGAIDLDTRPGLGAAFAVYLPALASPSPAATAATGSPPDPGARAPMDFALSGSASARVLFVDDDSSLVLMVRRRLERKGLRVSAFDDPQAALAALAADPGAYDLVVTDYNMPRLSGLDVTREVLAIRPDLPVVIASGYVDDAVRAFAKQAGARDFVHKANTAEAFCETLQRIAAEIVKGGAPG
jgi:PAS domain S-box-containing protein